MNPYYSEDGITIYNADCRDVLSSLPKVDLVLTDPPYDDKTHEGAVLSDAINFAPLRDLDGLVPDLLRQSKGWVICFCSLEMLGRYQSAAGDRWIRAGAWDRIVNMPQLSGDRPAQGAEGIAIMHPLGKKRWAGGGTAAIWRHSVERGMKWHPTQKPLGLLLELTALFSEAGDLILDPFMGSGTTLIAARHLGRQAIGIEIEERYCELAVRRLKGFTRPVAGQDTFNFESEHAAEEVFA